MTNDNGIISFLNKEKKCTEEISKKHEVIGVDLVEVAPDYDQSGSTSILAAQLLMNFIGFIFFNK